MLRSLSVSSLFCILSLSAPAWAASGGTPLVLVHQGLLVDAQDAPVTDPAASLEFRLLASPTSSAAEVAEWSASCVVPVARGRFVAALGAPPCAGDGLDSSDFAATSTRYLEVRVRGVTLSPRIAVGAVPLATVAADADRLGGRPPSDYLLKTEARQPGTAVVAASDIVSGTLPPARLAGTYDQALSLTNAGNVLAGQGAGITWLSATNLSTGTLPPARLSGTYDQSLALTNPGNTFRGTFEGTFVGVPTGTKMERSATRAACAATDIGTLYLNSDDDQVYVCGASGWKKVSQRPGTLRWADTSWSIGSVYATPASRTLTLHNDGDMPVSGLQIALPTHLSQQSTTCGTSLAGAATCTVTVATVHPGNPTTLGGDIVASGAGTTSKLSVTGQLQSLASCKVIKTVKPTATDGTYTIDPDGAGAGVPYDVSCDMTTAGGGWTRCLSVRYWKGGAYPSGWTKGNWVTSKWKTGTWALDRTPSGSNFGSFCTDLASQSTEFMGESQYTAASGWTAIRTNALALPSNFFAAGASQHVTVGGHALAIDTNGTGRYSTNCGTVYTGNTIQGIQSLCMQDGAHQQTMHTGWTQNSYPACSDSSNQPCFCTPDQYCGGSDSRELDIVMSIAVR